MLVLLSLLCVLSVCDAWTLQNPQSTCVTVSARHDTDKGVESVSYTPWEKWGRLPNKENLDIYHKYMLKHYLNI